MLWLFFGFAAWAAPPSPPHPVVGPSPIACPSTINVLNLPSGIDPKDPRLLSKQLIVVMKKARRVLRMSRGQLLVQNGQSACWMMGLGFTPEGHKQIEGDGKTPEGFYRSSDKPSSRFYAAIAIHYPNKKDAQAALKDGRIDSPTRDRILQALNTDQKPPQKTAMGGEILIHGGGGSTDWTLGCIAMDNAHLDALRDSLPTNMVTDVLILP